MLKDDQRTSPELEAHAMFEARSGKRGALCAILVLLVCNAAGAQPVLLAEYRHTESGQFYDWRNPVLPDGVPFVFRAGEATAGGGSWIQQINHSDVGQTFDAPPEIVDLFDDPFAKPTVSFSGRIGANATDWFAPLDYWINKSPNVPPFDHRFRIHVNELSNYRLTSLTRTVDSLLFEWIQEGRAYRAGGGQTIRLYGETIPEPYSSSLSMVALLSYLLLRLPHSPPTRSSRV